MARAFRVEMLKVNLKMLSDFLTLRDYDRAEKQATDRIIQKQSRGSVFAQNGWYLTRKALMKKSREADKRMKSLRAALHKNHS